MIRNTWISLDEPSDWNSALEGIPHAFGHTWESCHAMSLSTGYDTYLYVFETDGNRIVCPIAERSFRGHIDILTPYGFSGFVGKVSHPDFLQYWKQEAAARNYVCGYIGLNPILYDLNCYKPNEAYVYNCLYAIDLRLELDELFARLSTNRKRQLRAAGNNCKIIFERTRLLDFLLKHYADFFKRKGASTVYQFTPETIIELANMNNVILFGAEGKTGLEEVIMLAFTPYIGEYLLGISSNDARRHSVTLLWNAVKLLKTQGVEWFNLGGGVRPGDGVAQFKERFGGDIFPLKSLKQIYSKNLFGQLCKEVNADPNMLSGYFPPYHANTV
ncbi:MAG: hypothetical protein EA412_14725 [Chitinophagaceae bacterium]|nr:MAG: hypothetical protein EA412_14725 [Chitinophagaceae bacterium]